MLLDRQQFFVRERVAVLKLTDTYDILDPESQQQVGLARDEPSALAKFARLLVSRRLLPTTVNVYESESAPPVLSLRKTPGFLHATVVVTDAAGSELGRFRSKLFSLGGGFLVCDAAGSQVADVQGDWKGWNFRFLGAAGEELGVVTKKWAGVGRELFTTADSYMIALAAGATGSGAPRHAALLLAAGLAIDIVFKEK